MGSKGLRVGSAHSPGDVIATAACRCLPWPVSVGNLLRSYSRSSCYAAEVWVSAWVSWREWSMLTKLADDLAEQFVTAPSLPTMIVTGMISSKLIFALALAVFFRWAGVSASYQEGACYTNEANAAGAPCCHSCSGNAKTCTLGSGLAHCNFP